MCINLGSDFPTWLISPAAMLKQFAGVDPGKAKWMDPAYSLVAKTDKKSDEAKQEAEKTNADAWQKYYVSRDAQINSSSVLSSKKSSGF